MSKLGVFPLKGEIHNILLIVGVGWVRSKETFSISPNPRSMYFVCQRQLKSKQEISYKLASHHTTTWRLRWARKLSKALSKTLFYLVYRSFCIILFYNLLGGSLLHAPRANPSQLDLRPPPPATTSLLVVTAPKALNRKKRPLYSWNSRKCWRWDLGYT